MHKTEACMTLTEQCTHTFDHQMCFQVTVSYHLILYYTHHNSQCNYMIQRSENEEHARKPNLHLPSVFSEICRIVLMEKERTQMELVGDPFLLSESLQFHQYLVAIRVFSAGKLGPS